MNVLWTLTNLAVRDGERRRVGPLTLEIFSGFTAITGPSGAGKSTLLHVLAGFEPATSGFCKRQHPDEPDRIPLYWSPAGDGLWEHLSVEQHLRETGCAEPARFLDAFGLVPLANARPSRLSRGERHRVALARALASNARVLLLDEPLAHVGRQQAEKLWAFFTSEAGLRGISLVYATHDPGLIRSANHVIELEEGLQVQCDKNC